MPCFRCLISALTETGGGDLPPRFAISIHSRCGEGVALQADVAVREEHSPCFGQAASSSGTLSPGAARPLPPRRAARAARGLRAFSQGAACLFPPRRAARAARGLVPSPRAHHAFSLRGPSARCQSGLRKSLDRTRGLFAWWEGVASLGLSLPLSPPLPPTSSRDGATLLWSFSVPLFCEPPAVCSSRLIFPHSPTV